jgi:hypothetical protein
MSQLRLRSLRQRGSGGPGSAVIGGVEYSPLALQRRQQLQPPQVANNPPPAQEAKYARVLGYIENWRGHYEPIAEINSASVASLGLSSEEDNHLAPQLTKDVYYSIFVDKALSVAHAVGGNAHVLYELVYCMAFTPSPTGWTRGIDLAMASVADDNLVIRFVDCMVEQYDCVSAGEFRRCQVSHQSSVVVDEIIRSLSNLPALIELANSSDDTQKVVDSFCAKPVKGGLFLVGMLKAQEMIHVLTKIGLITNHTHMNTVLVAKGTKTSKRLETMGIKKDDTDELFAYLAERTNLSREQLENALCEGLRHHFSPNRRFYDTVARWQKIYTMGDDRTLRAYDLDGAAAGPIELPTWTRGNHSFRGIRWWNPGYEAGNGTKLRRVLKLTNN